MVDLVEGIEKPKLDIVVYVFPGEMEVPIEIPREEATPSFDDPSPVIVGKSYNNKRTIEVVKANVLFRDRLSEEEYKENIAKARAMQLQRQAMEAPIGIPMRIPRKLS